MVELHRHALNWLRTSQMVCGVSATGRVPVTEIKDLVCDRCVFRVLRTGQALGWSADDLARDGALLKMVSLWTPEREALWTLEKAK
jgi:hypothetical protein